MVEVTKAQARGEWIAYQRKLMGLTQPELADALGVSTNTINRTEKGSRVIGLDELDALAEFFGVEPDYLLNPPLPSTIELGPSVGRDVLTAHNVTVLTPTATGGSDVGHTDVYYPKFAPARSAAA